MSEFEIDIFQLAEDAAFAKNRTDGSGFDWQWSPVHRDWMDATPHAFAYRCLPLSIANQLGWQITNPVGFTAFWRGSPDPGSIDFRFDTDPKFWARWVNDQFGQGVLTWNTPFLFRTRPAGSRLLVIGPANHFKSHCHPLTALIETDWMTASFTMNYKIMEPCEKIRFEKGEPLLQIIPIAANVCADLEQARVTYQRLSDDPETQKLYEKWSSARTMFHEKKKEGQVRPHDWQKDYFKGLDPTGQPTQETHHTKIVPPKVEYKGTAKP